MREGARWSFSASKHSSSGDPSPDRYEGEGYRSSKLDVPIPQVFSSPDEEALYYAELFEELWWEDVLARANEQTEYVDAEREAEKANRLSARTYADPENIARGRAALEAGKTATELAVGCTGVGGAVLDINTLVNGEDMYGDQVSTSAWYATLILAPLGFIGDIFGKLFRGADDLPTTGASRASDDLGDASQTAEDLAAPRNTVIGRLDDIKPEKLRPGESTLLDRLQGDLGSPRANWQRNSSVLRDEIRKGKPIRDASAHLPDCHVLPDGRTVRDTFLGAERNTLRNKGWTFDGEFWNPPAQ